MRSRCCRFFAEACAVLACQVFGRRERSAAAAKATPDNTLVVRSSAASLSALVHRTLPLHPRMSSSLGPAN